MLARVPGALVGATREPGTQANKMNTIIHVLFIWIIYISAARTSLSQLHYAFNIIFLTPPKFGD